MDARKTKSGQVQAASIPGAGDGMQEIGMLRSATRIEVESNEGILSSSSSAMANAGPKEEEESGWFL